MDCNNMVSTLQWDWENLIMLNPSKTENDKKQISTECGIEKGEGIESIVPCFAGIERLSSGSSSTTSFWHTAVSKSSQSTSISSSSPTVKQYKLASECSRGDSCSNIDFIQVKPSTALKASVESGLCLKRTYSEESWGRNNNDISAVSMNLLTPSVVAHKKSKPCSQSMQVPRCQIDGCELDLSSAKEYHRKHRICENHSKCPKVIVGGLERRFCQQCSRLHDVSEFDENKRSCRKRLSHHNARRRKPQGLSFHPASSVYNRREHTNMLWNGFSLNTRSEEKFVFGTTYETRPTQTKTGFTLSFQRDNSCAEKLYDSSSHSFSAFQTSGKFSAGKSKFQHPDEGVGEYRGVIHESNDAHDKALSLLSSSSSDPLVQPHNQPLSLLFSYDGVLK